MWKVILVDKQAAADVRPETVVTANPVAEVKRFLFKNPKADIRVEFNGTLRREYSNGEIVVDVVEYPFAKKSLEDYGDALTFTAFVGERRDYMTDINGKTKKQRDRLLSRRVEAAQKAKAA